MGGRDPRRPAGRDEDRRRPVGRIAAWPATCWCTRSSPRSGARRCARGCCWWSTPPGCRPGPPVGAGSGADPDEVVAQLRVDGATAAVESMMTDPAARGRGHGDAVLGAAPDRAADAGCDLVVLEADAADRPRPWCARRGFRVVGSTWAVARLQGPAASPRVAGAAGSSVRPGRPPTAGGRRRPPTAAGSPAGP
ncbi:GNAT family N-acetyltransferase [Geodermatophilus pulveris]|uniref:GNAT family N-acetyltransferase n=1 Tax=Geodermatophilus pulveris TaxID=1564159 RepID=UPI002481ACE7|nr:GNAT family N-acetyltransferase [Geodermatophilus pulveris]